MIIGDENIEYKIKKIFCKVLGISENDVNDEIAYNTLEAWDSLKHLEIVSELEDEFNIDIEMDDVIAMETFGKIKEIVKKYLDKGFASE